MGRDSLLEKYNVSVSPFVADVLNRDMKNFGIKTRNALYNLVINTFYDLYEESREKEIDKIIELLDGKLKHVDEAESLAIQIIDTKRLYEMGDDDLLKQKKEVLPIKINSNTKSVIEKILNNLDEDMMVLEDAKRDKAIRNLKEKARRQSDEKADKIVSTMQNNNGGVPDYLRRLFTYYASMSAYKREKVLFAEKARIIQEAIDKNVTIDMVENNGNGSFRFKPFMITTNGNEQNAFVIGIVEDEKQTYGNRYSLFTMKLHKFMSYRTRKERKDIIFDEDYILDKYKDKIDDEFKELFNKLNMIIDLAHKYNFRYDEEIDSYVMDLSKMSKREVIYYEDEYAYDNEEEIIIPNSFMDTVLSIPVKLNMMMRHDPNFAYRIDEGVLVKVKYTAEGRDEYNKVYINRPEVVRSEDKDEVVYETTTMQASVYFRRLKGAKILEPKELNDSLIEWHKKLLLDLEK